MQPLTSRRVTAWWNASPQEVAAAIQTAIDQERYEDAGLASSFWLVRGDVRGLTLDLRMTTHSAPRAMNAYAIGLEVRGELVARGSGTELVARVSAANSRWTLPIILGFAAFFGVPMLLFGWPQGFIGAALIIAIVIPMGLVLFRLGERSLLAATPQAAAVLQRVGTPSAPVAEEPLAVVVSS